MNKAKLLPDAYAKNTESNIYKLLQLMNLIFYDFRYDLMSISRSRDLQSAKGKTLDRYGEMIGVARKGADDEQYRMNITAKIARNTTQSDCNSIIRSIAQIFRVYPEEIGLQEIEMQVYVIGLTIANLEESGYSDDEIREMLQELLPAGITLSTIRYSGTLRIDEPQSGTQLDPDYPVLKSAWIAGQVKQKSGDFTVGEYGLSGNGTVPDSWKSLVSQEIREKVKTSGTFEGGTLGK